jgi:hypothetical protein
MSKAHRSLAIPPSHSDLFVGATIPIPDLDRLLFSWLKMDLDLVEYCLTFISFDFGCPSTTGMPVSRRTP